MSDFRVIYRILRELLDAIDADEFDPQFDYQSDRHCAKTTARVRFARLWFDYQSDRHCAKAST